MKRRAVDYEAILYADPWIPLRRAGKNGENHHRKIMKRMKKYTVLFVGILFWMPTNLFAQYYSKEIIAENATSTEIGCLSRLMENKIGSIQAYVNDDFLSQGTKFLKFDEDGSDGLVSHKKYIRVNSRGFLTRNDTIFYSGRESVVSDSMYYWYFGMVGADGDSISEYKIPILPVSEGHVFNYGLTLVGGDEVILWGEGLDRRMPNPGNVAYRSVFVRMGLDGSVRSGPFWYEFNTFTERRMADATTDIDGNLVFAYEYFVIGDGPYRGVFKLLPDNQVQRIGFFRIKGSDLDFPRIAVDHEGNYITQSSPTYTLYHLYNTNRYTPLITKMSRSGEIIWQSLVPHIQHDFWASIFTDRFKLQHISVTKDNGVLCAGTLLIGDSLQIPGQQQKELVSGNISFIARFDSEGQLRWRHFLAPRKPNGQIRRNSMVDIKEAEDGSILVVGQLEENTTEILGKNHAWLLRLSPEGCLNDACDHLSPYWHLPDELVSVEDPYIRPAQVVAYPNPGSELCQISLPDAGSYQYEVWDISGRSIGVGYEQGPTVRLDMSYYPSGLYLIRLRSGSGELYETRWVKK